MPEWEQLQDAMDDITIGDVYRAIFPNGFLHTLNERVLLRYGITSESLIGKSLVFPDFSLHKIPIIPSTTSDEIKFESNSTSTTTDSSNEQFAENIYDDVDEERRKLRQQPFTGDYVYDQPAAAIDPADNDDDDDGGRVVSSREMKRLKMKFGPASSTTSMVNNNNNDYASINVLNWLQKFITSHR